MTARLIDGERMPITAAGYEQRSGELDRLRTIERRRLSSLLREARSDGSLEDNPTLVDLLEEHAHLERRIAMLEAQLADAEIAAPPSDGCAAVGSFVRVRNAATRDVFEYELVGPIEGDPANGCVSIAAPIGRALLGQRRGAEVVAATPRGAVMLTVLDVAASPPVTEAA